MEQENKDNENFEFVNDQAFNDILESPSIVSTSSEDEEMVEDSQLGDFAAKIEVHDEERRRDLSSQKYLEIIMTQVREEYLPISKEQT